MSASCVVDSSQRTFALQAPVRASAPGGAEVSTVGGLLHDDEVEWLQRAATGFERSPVQHDGGRGLSDVRTSSTATVPRGADDVVRCIERKVAQAAGDSVANLEGLQLTRYLPGQKYDTHHDCLPDAEARGNQRSKTLFAYLQDLGADCDDVSVCGGATVFPHLRGADGAAALRIYPERGTAAVWSNTRDGAPDDDMRHGGEPPREGAPACCGAEKMGLNAWFRERSYDPSDPQDP